MGNLDKLKANADTAKVMFLNTFGIGCVCIVVYINMHLTLNYVELERNEGITNAVILVFLICIPITVILYKKYQKALSEYEEEKNK